MFKRGGYSLLVMVLVLGVVVWRAPAAQAIVDSCTASVLPHTATTDATTTFKVTVNNTSSSTINWIRATQPSGDFNIITNTASGWLDSSNPLEAYETGGALSPGENTVVSILAQVGSTPAVSADWKVEVSDDDGINTIACSGSLGTDIIQATPANIFNISVTDAQPDSITVNWTTDTATTSQVNYGLDSSYGSSTTTDTSLKLNHSVHITGLTVSTGYHFQVISLDSLGVSAASSDNTFLTAATVTPPPGQQPGGLQTTPLNTTIPIKTTPTEKVAPTISLATILSQPFKQSPVINGTASDNEAVAILEYSLDGGKNWLPVDSASGLGGKAASFSFTPQNLQDNNYKLVVRATDTSGNQAVTATQTLIIDRLPPLVGGDVTTVGVQSVQPDKDGFINILAGLDQNITLSAVGGPTSVTIVKTLPGKDTILQSFALTQSPDTGLWSGVLSYTDPGLFQLVAKAVDGAGNTTSRPLNRVRVGAAGKITGPANKSIPATVVVYYREPETNTWVLWDGAAYDQPNPARVVGRSAYAYYLPEGTYYLKISSPGYQTTTTRSFTLTTPEAINGVFELARSPGLDFGPIHLRVPWFSLSQNDTKLTNIATATPKTLPNVELPQFTLQRTDGKILSTSQLYGKPTILTFINTWAPKSDDQLAILSDITTPSLNIVAVGSGESLARLRAYASIAGYHLPIVADSDNRLIGGLNASDVPTTYFLDRHGVVKKAISGVLSKQELLQNVSL